MVFSYSDNFVKTDKEKHGSGSAIRVRREAREPRAMNPKVLYAVMTTNSNISQAKVRAQIETWAARPIEQGRYFVTTGYKAGPVQQLAPDVLHEVSCDDQYGGVPCKEAHMLDVAFNRSAEWVVRLDDDHYADTELIEKTLGSLKPEDRQGPVVLALAYGCGTGSPAAKEYCPELAKVGGICGGGGYALNLAALSRFQSVGWHQMLKEYQALKNKLTYGDMVTSCVMLRRGMKLGHMNGGSAANGAVTIQNWEDIVKNKVLTYHHVTADLMRWIHAKLEGKPKDGVTAAEAKAFDTNGCCCRCAGRLQCGSSGGANHCTVSGKCRCTR